MNLPATVHHMPSPTEGITIDREAVLKVLNLPPNDPKTHALLLVCERYNLDPLLKHMVLISGNAYVTRDGYLAIAHRSGQFDGMEVISQDETPSHYIAKVAVYRKDMSRPFTFVGRFPKNKNMAKEYGPEMAVKVAEVQSLRRAFNVTGISAVDEMWDAQVDETGSQRPDRTAGAASASAAPPAYEPFTEEDETLVDFGTRIAFYDEMRKAFPGMKKKETDQLRHAIVHRATKGRTASSEGVLASEWHRVVAVFQAFVDGKLELVEDGDMLRLVLVSDETPADPE